MHEDSQPSNICTKQAVCRGFPCPRAAPRLLWQHKGWGDQEDVVKWAQSSGKLFWGERGGDGGGSCELQGVAWGLLLALPQWGGARCW